MLLRRRAGKLAAAPHVAVYFDSDGVSLMMAFR